MEVKRRINLRIILLALTAILLFVTLTVRMWWLQTVDAANIISHATWDWEKTLKPKRGAILDRNGEILAYEGRAYDLSARLKPRDEKDKDVVKDPYYTAQVLAPILNAPMDELLKKLTNPNSKVVELGRYGKKISEQQKSNIEYYQYPMLPNGEKVKTNQLPGIIVTETTRRYYPNNSFAAHVLGYMDFDDEPKMGLELQFDKELRGEKGEMQIRTDGAGYQLPDGERKYKPAKDGMNVYLTIDRTIQDYVEQALDKAEAEYKPKSMTVVVTDPQTGEVLAMGNRPQFDPNTYYKGITNFTNHAITSMFEPGSTFKIITLAAAIEEGKFNPNEIYQSGMFKEFKQPIRDHNNGVGWGPISFLEGVQRSSNVVFVIMGYKYLGPEMLKNYFEKFGIGSKTGIELPYEKEGILNNLLKPNSPRDIAVTTFGQGVAVTAIQQVAAVGAVANGGELLKPHIVKEIRDPLSGAVVRRTQREVVHRVVSEATAKKTRDILETVITGEKGTGKSYRLDSYQVAGKTGTAQKYDDKGRIMEGQHYIVSFIGFAPKDNPRLLVYVVVDDPTTTEDYRTWGGKFVAPIFKSVMERSLQYLQQKPDMTAAEKQAETVNSEAIARSEQIREVSMPKLVGMSTTAAKLRAEQDQLTVAIMGTGTKIASQYPSPYEKVVPGTSVTLVTDRLEGTKMPDLTGKSLREALEFGSLMQLQLTTYGVGFVTQQNIPPGTELKGGEQLQITLQPTSGTIISSPDGNQGGAEGVPVEEGDGENTGPNGGSGGTGGNGTAGTNPPGTAGTPPAGSGAAQGQTSANGTGAVPAVQNGTMPGQTGIQPQGMMPVYPPGTAPPGMTGGTQIIPNPGYPGYPGNVPYPGYQQVAPTGVNQVPGVGQMLPAGQGSIPYPYPPANIPVTNTPTNGPATDTPANN
ncbi:penicillin-binding transpeptidase domain-containing protein [Brevibacillus ruminantium]|uniref:Penicillin-binding transpeptidase domain-containing protein n=1 Tax=Brevibacillus ruminantium TaxID=2950604 RepID=A0ABY4WL26_9BACL|nr:penicillin-binding transpeptidase domain-containing protein [Brevibacillus ruminantium]USG67554.1 penicillin-binding transpeptidase domain-containing protein [Brevibacillus ruminantium]